MARHWLVATALIATAVVAHTAPVEWPSYNRTLTSERFVTSPIWPTAKVTAKVVILGRK